MGGRNSMRRRTFKSTPAEPVDPSVQGEHYIVIYKRANGIPEYGVTTRIQPGDVVEFRDSGIRTAEVASVKGKGDKMSIRTKAVRFQGFFIRKAETLMVRDLTKILRLRPDLKVVIDPDTLRRSFVTQEVKPVEPPPPLPTVKFAPVEPPKKVGGSKAVPAPQVVKPVRRRRSASKMIALETTSPVVKAPAKEEQSGGKPVPVVRTVRPQIREASGGFLVVGKNHQGNPIRIAVKCRDTAEKIIAVYKDPIGRDLPKEIGDLLKTDRTASKVQTPNPETKSESPAQKWRKMREQKGRGAHA